MKEDKVIEVFSSRKMNHKQGWVGVFVFIVGVVLSFSDKTTAIGPLCIGFGLSVAIQGFSD